MTDIPQELKDILDEADESVRAAKLTAYIEKVRLKAVEEGKNSGASLVSMFTAQSPAAKDPVLVMREVFKDKDYDSEEKAVLYFMSRERFQNRRRMAYVSLSVLVAGTLFIGAAFLSDGINYSANYADCLTQVRESLEASGVTDLSEQLPLLQDGCDDARFLFTSIFRENSDLLTWVGTFFTSVIALYYGAASFRPTS